MGKGQSVIKYSDGTMKGAVDGYGIDKDYLRVERDSCYSTFVTH